MMKKIGWLPSWRPPSVDCKRGLTCSTALVCCLICSLALCPSTCPCRAGLTGSLHAHWPIRGLWPGTLGPSRGILRVLLARSHGRRSWILGGRRLLDNLGTAFSGANTLGALFGARLTLPRLVARTGP